MNSAAWDFMLEDRDPRDDPRARQRMAARGCAGNCDRMWYAQRLAEGKPIGSGAIEIACKKVGSRLKLNSARWRVKRADRFGALLCLEYADQSENYWSKLAA